MTNRCVSAVFAVVAVYLAISATPVSAASTGLAVGSEHTTESDFSAGTLTNATVSGSGMSADVRAEVYDGETVATYDFESGDLSEWSSASDWSITPSAKQGSYAAESGQTDNNRYMYRGEFSGDHTVRGWVQARDVLSGNDATGLGLNVQAENTGYGAQIGEGNDVFSLVRLDNGDFNSLDSASVSIQPDTWYWIEVERDGGKVIGRLFDGNPSNGGTLLKTVSATDTTYTSGAAAGYRYGGSRVDNISVVRPNTETARYLSANHSAKTAIKGWTNLTLTNASATVEWQAWTGAQWQVVNSSQYSSTGNYTLDISAADYGTWRVNVSFEKTGLNPTAQLHDEGVLFDARPPTGDEGAAAPQGKTQNSGSIELSLPVTDPDFNTTQGDQVTAEFFVNGNSVGADTLTENRTASVTTDINDGGDYQWHAELTDSYGETTTTNMITFQLPSTLFIKNVSAPEQKIDTSADVTAQLYSGEVVFERSAENGEISFDGLPTDRRYVVKVDADGYHARTIAIESIFEQEDIYLLNNTRDSSKIVFSINDETGRFSENPELYVERPLTINNSTNWQVVTGNELGATNEFVTTLETGVTYRLRVKNEDGEERILNRYSVSGDAAATIPIGQISLTSDVEEGVAFGSKLIETDNGRAVRVVYRDPDRETSELSYEITRRNNESDVLLENTTEVGPYGRYIATVPLDANTTGGVSYEVRYHAVRDTASEGGSVYVGDVPEIASDWNIDSQLLGMLGYVGILSLTGLVVIKDPLAAPIVAVVSATAFTWMGVVSIHPAALGIGGATALLYNVAGRR